MQLRRALLLASLAVMAPSTAHAETVAVLPVQTTRGTPATLGQRVFESLVRHLNDSGVNTLLPVEDPDHLALNLRSCGASCVETTLAALGTELALDVTVARGDHGDRELLASAYFDDEHIVGLSVGLGNDVDRAAADLVAVVLSAHRAHTREHPRTSGAGASNAGANVATSAATSSTGRNATTSAAAVHAGTGAGAETTSTGPRTVMGAGAETTSTGPSTAAQDARDGSSDRDPRSRRRVSAWSYVLGGGLVAGGAAMIALGAAHVARRGDCVAPDPFGGCPVDASGSFTTYASGPADLALIIAGSVTALGGTAVLVTRPIRVSGAASRDGAALVLRGSF